MQLKDFDYHLPPELIAESPPEVRGSSRLLTLTRDGNITHGVFSDLKGYLKAGDVLVLNDTRVIPARIYGRKESGGGVELLLVSRTGPPEGPWRCMAKPAKGMRPGARLVFDRGITATVRGIDDDGFVTVAFEGLDPGTEVYDALGEVPLPPYIRRPAGKEDSERYQTVYAASSGAVAAPTAGLHFTAGLLAELEAAGVLVLRITLHTGPGTFLPVRVEKIEEHRMLPEAYSIPAEVFGAVKRARAEGRRIIAAGTTTTRALEGAVAAGMDDPVLSGSTDLFIYPGYEFKVVDALITNFHLPGSTLLMLVSAFAGRENIMRAYEEAVKERYRFYSYGDAMFIY